MCSFGVGDQKGVPLTDAGKVEGHVGDATGAAIQQQRLTQPAQQRRMLIHPAGGRPGHLVLGADAGGGQRCAGVVTAQQA